MKELSDFKTCELIEALEFRGHSVDEDVHDINEFSDEELEDEILLRGGNVSWYDSTDIEKLCDFLIDNNKYKDFPLELTRFIEDVSNRNFVV